MTVVIATEATDTREAGAQTVEREQFVLVQDEAGTVFRALTEVTTSAEVTVAGGTALVRRSLLPEARTRCNSVRMMRSLTSHKWSNWRPAELPDDSTESEV